jgi:beta-glucanase (GH16 family)
VQPIDFSAGFHTFSVEWNASSITWSVDGVAYWQRAPAADAAHAQWNAEYLPYSPMYLILNTAVGAESWSGCRCGQLAGEFNSSHPVACAPSAVPRLATAFSAQSHRRPRFLLR